MLCPKPGTAQVTWHTAAIGLSSNTEGPDGPSQGLLSADEPHAEARDSSRSRMGVVAVWAVEVPSQTSSLTDGLIAAEIERMPRAPQRRRADAANQSGGLPWIGAQGNRPCCTAYAAAAARELTPILPKMLLMWVLGLYTVLACFQMFR